jgi:hypothetical protein
MTSSTCGCERWAASASGVPVCNLPKSHPSHAAATGLHIQGLHFSKCFQIPTRILYSPRYHCCLCDSMPMFPSPCPRPSQSLTPSNARTHKSRGNPCVCARARVSVTVCVYVSARQCVCVCMCMCACVCMCQPCACARTRACALAHARAQLTHTTRTLAHTHGHRHRHTHARMHACTHTQARAHTPWHIYCETRAHARIHTGAEGCGHRRSQPHPRARALPRMDGGPGPGRRLPIEVGPAHDRSGAVHGRGVRAPCVTRTLCQRAPRPCVILPAFVLYGPSGARRLPVTHAVRPRAHAHSRVASSESRDALGVTQSGTDCAAVQLH